MNFKDSLDNHLKAIADRNLEGFAETLVKDDRLTLVLPNCSVISGYDETVKFHKNWFADPDWHLETSLIKTLESESSCTALFDVVYSDVDETGAPYQMKYVLSLTFVHEQGAWLLVFDQNTMKS